jgi:predicted RNase H-like HicB family nuclease
MLVYKAAYKLVEGVYLSEVLDFPGTVSFGTTLDEARRNLAGAFYDMAETNLRASGQNSLPPCGGGVGWGVEMLAAKELPPPTPTLPHKGGGRKVR